MTLLEKFVYERGLFISQLIKTSDFIEARFSVWKELSVFIRMDICCFFFEKKTRNDEFNEKGREDEL